MMKLYPCMLYINHDISVSHTEHTAAFQHFEFPTVAESAKTLRTSLGKDLKDHGGRGRRGLDDQCHVDLHIHGLCI